jgi:polyribonucleotide 5'-hydroxyl-kinase
LLHAAQEFEVGVILVLDQERLRVELQRDLPDYVKVLSVLKSGGVVSKSHDARSQFKNMRIHEYFYGSSPKQQLYPHSIELNFNECKIYKIGAPQLPDSLLPMGMKPEDNFTRVFQITPCKF